MSENNLQDSIPIDDYVDCVADITITNQVNSKQMEKLFREVVEQAKRYRAQCQTSAATIEGMKHAMELQHKKIHRLRNELDEKSKKLEVSEKSAKSYATKYHRIYNQLKAIVLSAATENNNDNNNDNA